MMRAKTIALKLGVALFVCVFMAGCSLVPESDSSANEKTGIELDSELKDADEPIAEDSQKKEEASEKNTAEVMRSKLNIIEDMRASFVHGEKGAEVQNYIMLHDTESESDPASIVDYWDGNGNLVAAHFVVGMDGSIVQCVPLDKIAHHAGFGDTGHNELYGVTDESRDDKNGTQPIGSWASDYGMNSYSIGIELVHLGSSQKDYPASQLEALDNLIAYLDAYFSDTERGDAGAITDHKAWRTGNSDTSAEFAQYLASYQEVRTHNQRYCKTESHFWTYSAQSPKCFRLVLQECQNCGDTFSIDYLIGNEDYLGKGYGKTIVKILTDTVYQVEHAKHIIVQPDKENQASNKALLANGYIFDKNKNYYCKSVKG